MNNILELYARSAKSLFKIGLCEAALPIAEIKNAMKLFSENKMLILGGDLYKETTLDNFEFIYESWFYEGNNVEESIGKALNYLNPFQGQQVFIVFVLKNK